MYIVNFNFFFAAIVNLKNATFTLNGILNFVIKAEKGNDNEIIVHTRIQGA